MKTGILTFPRAINYGAALQAAALSRTLKDRSCEVKFLSHENKETASSSKVFDLSKITDIKYTVAHLINLTSAIKRKRNFSSFCKKYMDFGTENPSDYDIVITGSDQVWNYKLTGEDWLYFLDFEKKNTKKVSYAASFGLSELDEEHKNRIAGFIHDIDFLSVREKTAADIISGICNKKASVVVDPTLLLTKEQWTDYSSNKVTDSGFIFVYSIFGNDRIWEYAGELSEKTGLPVKTISYSKLHRRNAIYDFTAGPDSWLDYMLKADFVVTDSFHGVAFSINFNKNFFFDLPPAKAGVGSRISDITERYELSGRNISGENFTFTTKAPDFRTANKKLCEDREASFGFIESFLNSK